MPRTTTYFPTPVQHQLRRNIAAWWARATDRERQAGAAWYSEARRLATGLAVTYGLSVECVAAIVAVLSPMVRWERNLDEAERVIRRAKRRDARFSRDGHTAFSANVAKAWRIARAGFGYADVDVADAPSGLKVAAFYRLILSAGAGTDMCVDSIALFVALGVQPDTGVTSNDAKEWFSRPRARREIAEAYRDVARALNVFPSTVQAVTWLVWRGERDKS